ncbi:MAG: site-2 protease family protein [Fuerstiella sp.]|nr:site-2 protease family protein [Fuerstiella sp.]
MSDSDSPLPPNEPAPASAKRPDEDLSSLSPQLNPGKMEESRQFEERGFTENSFRVPSAPVLSHHEAATKYRHRRRRQLRLCIFLFLSTWVSTTLVGSGFVPLVALPGFFDTELQETILADFSKGQISPSDRNQVFSEWYSGLLMQGFSYSIPLMLILLCHEMGHFLQAVRYRVPASFPFFIPLPIPPLGTMGAVIAQGRGAADRKQMFDIAVSGPLAGLFVTLPILYFGIEASHFEFEFLMAGRYVEFGEPLIIQWFITWIHGPTPNGQILVMHGMAHAGWVGIFVTALNLIPIGQLDGGHLAYTLLGKPAHWIAFAVVFAAAGYMIATGTYSYILFLILILVMGMRHPPTRDDTVSLGTFRHVLGWLTLAFLLIGFTPTPIVIGQG